MSFDEWNPAAGSIHPDLDRNASYTEIFEDYLALYPATVEIAHRLAERQRRAAV